MTSTRDRSPAALRGLNSVDRASTSSVESSRPLTQCGLTSEVSSAMHVGALEWITCGKRMREATQTSCGSPVRQRRRRGALFASFFTPPCSCVHVTKPTFPPHSCLRLREPWVLGYIGEADALLGSLDGHAIQQVDSLRPQFRAQSKQARGRPPSCTAARAAL